MIELFRHTCDGSVSTIDVFSAIGIVGALALIRREWQVQIAV